MAILKMTMTVQCLFRDRSHLDTIIATATENAKQVLTNIVMLTPDNIRTSPTVKLVIEEPGEDDKEIDIATLMKSEMVPMFEEDPFA